MIHNILGHDHIQWHPQLIRHYTTLWTYYRTGPYYRFCPYYPISGGFHRTLQRMRLANRGRLLLRTLGPVPFGLAFVFMLRPFSHEFVMFFYFDFKHLSVLIFCLEQSPVHTSRTFVSSKNECQNLSYFFIFLKKFCTIHSYFFKYILNLEKL